MLEFYEPQADFGTPQSDSQIMVTLSIDGVQVTVPEGSSVMRAASVRYRFIKVVWFLPDLFGRN